MLTAHLLPPQRPTSPARRPAARQRGMVLVVALIVLVLVTLGALAVMRSVDTTTLLTGNLAFQQASLRASDTGVEAAITMLQTKAASVGSVDLNSNDTSNGYFATLQAADSPSASQSWRAFWAANLNANSVSMPVDQFGNTVQYVVHRMCANPQAPASGGQCVTAAGAATTIGNAEEAGQLQLQGTNGRIYYRITVRVTGPRRTESYVQTHVAM